jgi:hypothetical protein
MGGPLSLHGKLWNESLDREIFSTRKEAEILIKPLALVAALG